MKLNLRKAFLGVALSVAVTEGALVGSLFNSAQDCEAKQGLNCTPAEQRALRAVENVRERSILALN
jgi:hypothetical protein